MTPAEIEQELPIDPGPPDGAIRWPPIGPIVIGILPILLLCPLVFFEGPVKWIGAHPVWSFLIGAGVLAVWLARFGAKFARGLDFLVRTADFWLNRTYGPRLKEGPLRDKVRLLCKCGGFLKGYSAPIILWTFLTLAIAILGPARSQLNDPWALLQKVSWQPVVACLIVITLVSAGFVLFSWWKPWLRLFTNVLILSAIAVVCCWLSFTAAGSNDQSVAEADHLIYPHVFLLFAGVACGLAYLSRFLASGLMSRFKEAHRRAWTLAGPLGRVELFGSPERPRFTLGNVLRSAVETPLRNPHLFLFPIAVVVLLTPHAFMTFWGVVTALFAWSVLAAAGVHDRLSSLLEALTRNFFQGVLWAASIFVIVLAACRLFDFSYVATVVNSTSFASLLAFIVSIYATLWFYKYWVGYSLCEQMLDILRPGPNQDEQGKAQLEYAIEPGYKHTAVLEQGRFVQVHGTRFAAVGTYEHDGTASGAAWEFYNPVALFEAIVKKQPDHPGAVVENFGLSDLRQRVYFYNVFLDALVALSLAVFLWWGQTQRAKAELAAAKHAPGVFKFDDVLFGKQDGSSGDREKPKALILVAVSGGGTRAALYGGAVFRALNEFGALKDVQLCSGVSGGSTAIAHLALHRALLTDPNKKVEAWNDYRDAMSAPFIDEVLCGTLEWRVARGTRMGTLLDESFRRHLERKLTQGQGVNLADATVGVIFNTTLAGTQTPKTQPDPTNAGSRLIVTNLALGAQTFPTLGFPGAQGEFLPYVVVQDPTARLTTGAALSANFPPVFSNAKVDLKENGVVVDTHWVTDGGVAENRGDISLLYVLLDALNREKAAANRRVPLPVVIVIAEASGVSLDFTEDRGLGSMLGASGRFANQLMVELLEKIERKYNDLKGESLQVHYLPMPLVLRSRGGVGTHWMMPAFVTLANPRDRTKTMIITGKQASQMIMDLYVADGKRDKDSLSNELKQAWEWIDGTDAEPRFAEHRLAWIQLVETLKKLRYVESPP
jgi:Patatin-like phospholipase